MDRGDAGMTGTEAALGGFAERMRAGGYREASDLLEGAWRRARNDLAKALIKVAVALYQWHRGRRRGARRLLEGALELLGPGRVAAAGAEARPAAGGAVGAAGRRGGGAEGGWPRPDPDEEERLLAAVRGCLAAVRDGREPPPALVEEVALFAEGLARRGPGSGPALR